MSHDVIFLAQGLCTTSVCVPENWTREEIEKNVNAASPTGITSSWYISDDPTFANGEANGCTCEQELSRRHWLMHC